MITNFKQEDIITLAIETSCDETSASILKNGREVLSNIINSQIEQHKKFGGVVPEVASRRHIENINDVIEEALTVADVSFADLTHVGVTHGPGLVGALLVGLSAAKAIAFAREIPLNGVNHIEGHIYANFIEHKQLGPPFISLVVSGGHTHLVYMEDYGKYEVFPLYLFLCILNGICQKPVLDNLVLAEPHPVNQTQHSVSTKDPHQIVP